MMILSQILTVASVDDEALSNVKKAVPANSTVSVDILVAWCLFLRGSDWGIRNVRRVVWLSSVAAG
jgi:hypothetical protein